jgi:hypothetical protein
VSDANGNLYLGVIPGKAGYIIVVVQTSSKKRWF